MPKVLRNNQCGAIQLSPNFFLTEFTRCGLMAKLGVQEAPNPGAVRSLFQLAKLMEQVRLALGGRTIHIVSGFHSVKLNELVADPGGSDDAHMLGEACDFTCDAFGTPLQIVAKLEKSGLAFGKLAVQGDWVHIELPT